MHLDWTAVLSPAMDAVATGLAAVLIGLVVRLAQKWNLEISAAKQEAWRAQLADIIRRVEEQAAKRAGSAAPMSSEDKRNQALTLAQAMAPKGKDRGAIDDEIHALLPALGLGMAAKAASLPAVLAEGSPVPVPGINFDPPPPGSVLAQATAIVTEATAALEPGKTGALVGIATTRGVNAAIVQKLGEHWSVVGWAGKEWGQPLAAGGAVKASW